MDDLRCLKCGRCCYFFVKGKVVKCGNLVLLKGGKTRCRVYASRLGRPLGGGMVCSFRCDSVWDFKDCPLNCGRPLFPVDVKGECLV